MKSLDLAGGGRRERSREEMVDPVVATDPVEEHLARSEPEAIGENLAVVGQDLFRGAISFQGRGEVPAHLTADGSGHDVRAHHEATAVVNAGQGLASVAGSL